MRNIEKLGIFVFALVMILASNVLASEESVTNIEFADLLVRSIGIELPEGTSNLSDTEYFEVVSNIFSERGLTQFSGTAPESSMTAGKIAEIIFAMMDLNEEWDVGSKMSYLQENGLMPVMGINDKVSLKQASEILNNPLLADVVAEAYQDPGGIFAPERASIDAPGFTLEDVPSQV